MNNIFYSIIPLTLVAVTMLLGAVKLAQINRIIPRFWRGQPRQQRLPRSRYSRRGVL